MSKILDSIVLKDRKTNKLKKIRKKYTKKSFDDIFKENKVHFKTMVKDNENKANLVILFDINTPNGEENNRSKGVYVHYLKLNNKKYMKFERPNPPKGTHNYHSLSVMLNEKDIKELEKRLEKKLERNHNMFRNLGKKQILNIKFNNKNIIRENSFQVSR